MSDTNIVERLRNYANRSGNHIVQAIMFEAADLIERLTAPVGDMGPLAQFVAGFGEHDSDDMLIYRRAGDGVGVSLGVLRDAVARADRLRAALAAPVGDMVDVPSADMLAFGASDFACMLYPDDTPEHRLARKAYCEGAAGAAPIIARLAAEKAALLAPVGDMETTGEERALFLRACEARPSWCRALVNDADKADRLHAALAAANARIHILEEPVRTEPVQKALGWLAAEFAVRAANRPFAQVEALKAEIEDVAMRVYCELARPYLNRATEAEAREATERAAREKIEAALRSIHTGAALGMAAAPDGPLKRIFTKIVEETAALTGATP